MNKSRRKRIISTLALCAVSMTTLMSTGCGKSNDDDEYTIAVITKQDIAFWHDVQNGAEDAGEELNAKILYNEGGESDYPQGDNDFATQVEYIDYAIKEGVDAIVIAPNATTELNEAFNKAEAAGIKLININSRAQYGGILSCVHSSDADAGAVGARYAADAVLGSDKVRLVMTRGDVKLDDVKELGRGAVAIMPHTAATAAARVGGFKSQAVASISKQMASDGVDISKIGLTEQEVAAMFQKFFVDCEPSATVDAAYEEAKRVLSDKDSNVICFFATNTNTTLGVCKAVDELGLQDTVYVIGFNSDDSELNYLKRGVLDGTIIQNPYNMGYVGVRYAVNASKGSGVPGDLDTGVTYITAETMNTDYVKLLLNPRELD